MVRHALLATVSVLACVCALVAIAGDQGRPQANDQLAAGVGRLAGDRQDSTELEKLVGQDINKNIIIDVGAKWCPHCKAMQPIIDEIKKDYIVYEVDADKNPALAKELKARSLPTYVVFDQGKEVNRLVGEQTKSALVANVKTRAEQDAKPAPVVPDYNFTKHHGKH